MSSSSLRKALMESITEDRSLQPLFAVLLPFVRTRGGMRVVLEALREAEPELFVELVRSMVPKRATTGRPPKYSDTDSAAMLSAFLHAQTVEHGEDIATNMRDWLEQEWFTRENFPKEEFQARQKWLERARTKYADEDNKAFRAEVDAWLKLWRSLEQLGQDKTP